MSEQPTIGKIEQLTTNDSKRNAWDILSKYAGIVEAPPEWSSLSNAELWKLVARLRAENTRLREALAKYADHDGWQQAPSDFGNVDSDPYDYFMCDGNGWETAEAALANETTTAV